MIRRLSFRFIACLYIVFIFFTSAFFFVIALAIWLVTIPFDPRLWALHRFTCFWASLYIWVFPPWSVAIQGRDKIRKDETYVMVSNHQSLVDILVIFTLFRHFKWVSKAELFNIPLIGWNMFLNNYVRLERGRNTSVKKMYTACERHLEQGSSIFLFPEGTRSDTGHMRKFKEGAFVLAQRLQVPVLPIVIRGSRDALPKNSLNFHGHTNIQVSVLDPIAPSCFAGITPGELAQRIQEIIQKQLDDTAC